MTLGRHETGFRLYRRRRHAMAPPPALGRLTATLESRFCLDTCHTQAGGALTDRIQSGTGRIDLVLLQRLQGQLDRHARLIPDLLVAAVTHIDLRNHDQGAQGHRVSAERTGADFKRDLPLTYARHTASPRSVRRLLGGNGLAAGFGWPAIACTPSMSMGLTTGFKPSGYVLGATSSCSATKQAERSYGWDGRLREVRRRLPRWLSQGGAAAAGHRLRPARSSCIANNVSIDPRRVYVTGMSNGAIVTLACNTKHLRGDRVVSERAT